MQSSSYERAIYLRDLVFPWNVMWRRETRLRESAELFRQAGNEFISRGEYDLAFDSYGCSVEVYRSIPDHVLEGNVLHLLGDAQFHRGDKDDSIATLLIAVSAYEGIYPERMLSTLLRIGFCQESIGEKPSALVTYKRALPVAEEIGLTSLIVDVLQKIINVSIELREYQEAGESYKKLADVYKSVNSLTCHNLVNAIVCYLLCGEIDRAKEAISFSTIPELTNNLYALVDAYHSNMYCITHSSLKPILDRIAKYSGVINSTLIKEICKI